MGKRGTVLSKVSERPRAWLDHLDLDDLADDLRDRVDDGRDRLDDLRDAVGDPRERVEDLRDAAVDTAESAQERWEDLQPTLRALAIQVLKVIHAAIELAMFVPRLVVRALGAVGDLLDRAEVAREKGYELSERARDVARSVPPSRRGRWKRRLTGPVLVGGGFAVGFAVGWFAGSRLQDDASFEEPAGLAPVAEPLRPVSPETAEGRDGDQPETGTGA